MCVCDVRRMLWPGERWWARNAQCLDSYKLGTLHCAQPSEPEPIVFCCAAAYPEGAVALANILNIFQGALCKSLDNVHLFLCSSKDFRHLEFADSVSVLLSVSLLITILFASIIHQCVKLLQIEIHHGIYLHSLLWYSCNHSDALCACCSHPPPPPASSRAAGPCRGFGGLLDKELSM